MRQIKVIFFFFFFKWFCISFSSLDVLALVATSLCSWTLWGADPCPVARGGSGSDKVLEWSSCRSLSGFPDMWREADPSRAELGRRAERGEMAFLAQKGIWFASISPWLVCKQTIERVAGPRWSRSRGCSGGRWAGASRCKFSDLVEIYVRRGHYLHTFHEQLMNWTLRGKTVLIEQFYRVLQKKKSSFFRFLS